MSAPLPPGHTRRPAASAQTGKQDEARCKHGHTEPEHWQDGRYSCPTPPAPSAGQDELPDQNAGPMGPMTVLQPVTQSLPAPSADEAARAMEFPRTPSSEDLRRLREEGEARYVEQLASVWDHPASSAGQDTERLRDAIAVWIAKTDHDWTGVSWDDPYGARADSLLDGPLRQAPARLVSPRKVWPPPGRELRTPGRYCWLCWHTHRRRDGSCPRCPCDHPLTVRTLV